MKPGTLYFLSTFFLIIAFLLFIYDNSKDDSLLHLYLFVSIWFAILSILAFLPFYFIILRLNTISIKVRQILSVIIAIICPLIYFFLFMDKPYRGFVLTILSSLAISRIFKKIFLRKNIIE